MTAQPVHAGRYGQREASAAGQLARLTAERDAPRCGLCDRPSSTPLCRECRPLIGSRREAGDSAPLPCPSCPGKLAHHDGACAP